MKDETVIKKYYNILWTLDRSDQSALSPDYEEDLIKQKDKLQKIIDKRKLWNHELLIKLDEASLK